MTGGASCLRVSARGRWRRVETRLASIILDGRATVERVK